MSNLKTVECRTYFVSQHCQRAIDIRDILLDDVINTVEQGEIIALYDNDRPFPSKLLLNFINGKPLHVVVAQDKEFMSCILITAYIPDEHLWEADFKSKKII